MKKQKKETKLVISESRCDSCEFFDADDFEGEQCMLSLDEDEFADFLCRNTGTCPYYRFYDEYKSVQKQN